MSLIQEALKRQQQETGEGELKPGAPPLQRPAASPTKPEPPPLKNETPTESPAEPEAPAPWDKSKKKETAGAKAGKTVFLILLLAAVGGIVWYQLKPPAKITADSRPPADMPTKPSADPKSDPVALSPAQGTSEPDPIAQPLTPEPLQIEIEWPSLSLDGIVGSGAQGSCLINNQIVRVGEHVQEVKIVAIRKDGVELEYQGEKRFLRVGASTR